MGDNRKYFFAAGLSGLLSGLAYPGWGFDGSTGLTTGLGWLVWVGLIPLLWSLTQFTYKSDRFSVRNGFLIGFAAGLVYFLIVFRWLWSIHPLDTLGIESGVVSFVAVLLIYLVSSGGMAIFWGLAGTAIGKRGGNKLANILSWLAVPAIFVILEYLRSWGFGFLWAGSGSLFGPHWTQGNLAYSLADNSLALKFASFVGIYGVTFVVILVNCLVFWILMARFTKALFANGAFVGLIIVAVALGPKLIKTRVMTQENAKQINFAIIQTAQQTKLSPSPQEILAGFKEQLELLDRVARERPESQLIVFPEASDFFKNLSLFMAPAQVESYFKKLFKEPRLIISGGRVLDSTTGSAYSRVFSLDTQGDIIGHYDKRLLTPGGEFLPYPIRALAYIFSKNKFSLFNGAHDLSPGQKEISTVGFRYQFNAAPLVCSELISPSIAKQATQNADIIVSMASYGIFHGNRTIADQMLAITRFRAAENHKPIITAANMGRSHVIDSEGNIINISGTHPVRGFISNGAGILTGSVAIGNNKSWYNKVGDAPVVLGCLLLAIIAILKTRGGQIKNWLRRNQS